MKQELIQLFGFFGTGLLIIFVIVALASLTIRERNLRRARILRRAASLNPNFIRRG